MTLPLETINGKQYQPVECDIDDPLKNCDEDCVFKDEPYCHSKPCRSFQRDDALEVYYIEPGDTNEQE